MMWDIGRAQRDAKHRLTIRIKLWPSSDMDVVRALLG